MVDHGKDGLECHVECHIWVSPTNFPPSYQNVVSDIWVYFPSAIPLVGSAFDVAYKPNMRNLILLQEHLRQEAINAGQDPEAIDEALRQSRAELLTMPGEESRPLLPPRPQAADIGNRVILNH